ncbi:MAG: ferritin-like domain-containing protein [Acetobacteraceae bacterium]|nr:ferritin-like domain-containing protein [Acetobacteraceae bacterium]
MPDLKEMLVDQLKDAHSAERQAIQLMKRTLRKVSEPQLREGIEAHIAQSEEQRERLEQALERMGSRLGRKVCEAMRGLAEEAQHELEEHDKGPVLDIVIVASQQRVEHYEIAAYGTMVELARAMKQNEVANLLAQTLEEEKQQDQRMTELTRQSLLPAAMAEEGAMDEDEEEQTGASRSSSSASASRRRTRA